MVALPKTYLRPISSAVVSQSQTLAAQNSTPVAFLPQVRSFQTSPVTRDIDSAAKFIGAGAATVGVAGSGECCVMEESPVHTPSPAQSFRHSSLPIFCCVVWKRFSFRACRNLALGAHIRVPGYSFTKHTIKCLGKV